MIPTLKTQRLILRAATLDDAPAVQKYFNNWDIIKYIGAQVPWPYPDDGAQTHLIDCIEKMKNKNFYLWAICLKEKPEEAIGLIEYRFIDDKDDNRGFWLAEAFWGKGLMSEAVVATQDYIFFETEHDSIVIKNAASHTIKKKYGAVLIEETDDGEYHTGETQQEVWKITRESWTNIREQRLVLKHPQKTSSPE